MKNLKTHLERLFKVVEEEFPDEYERIIFLTSKNRARLMDSKESVILMSKSNKIRVIKDRNKELSLPMGKFRRETIIMMLDGELTLNEAVKTGMINCTGREQEILLFFKMLRIILNVSARSVRAYMIWKDFK